MKKLPLILSLLISNLFSQTIVDTIKPLSDDGWSVINTKGISGVYGKIYTIRFHNGSLYAGGTFSYASNQKAANLVRWDDNACHPYPKSSLAYIEKIAIHDSETIYAYGNNGIVKWNGSEWQKIGTPYYEINDMACFSNGDLLIGGKANSIDGKSIGCIAIWNGTQWWNFGGVLNGTVYSIFIDKNDTVYLAGNFGSKCLAKWIDDTTWQIPLIWANNYTYGLGATAMTIDDSGHIFLGGRFRYKTIMDTICNLIKWDGTTAKSIDDNLTSLKTLNNNIYSLIKDNAGNIYLNGYFASGFNTTYKRTQDGWEALGSGVPVVGELAVDENGKLYLGTNKSNVNDNYFGFLYIWDGNNWEIHGDGVDGHISSLYAANKALFIGGNFTSIFGIPGNIVRWDGNSFIPLETGTDSTISCLTGDNKGNLYAAGNFTKAGVVPALHIAKWDGLNWSALGSGIPNSVNTLITDKAGNLYAGGSFDTAGGIEANNVAKWDGLRWNPMSYGMNAAVNSLCIDKDGNLYAGGDFITASGDFAHYVATWNGTEWIEVGAGLSNPVKTLACDNQGNLYALLKNNLGIAKWDGISWKLLDFSKGISISTINTNEYGHLIIGGNFKIYSFRDVIYNLALFDGKDLFKLGSGLDSTVQSMSVFKNLIFVSGDFINAGGKTTPLLAKFDLNKATSTVKTHFAGKVSVNCHYNGRHLIIRGYSPGDIIQIFSLSGKLIKRSKAISVMDISDITGQTLVINLLNNNRIKYSGIILSAR